MELVTDFLAAKSINDLPTVQEFLKAADWDVVENLLVNRIYKDKRSIKRPKSKRQKKYKAKLEKALEEICDMKVEPNSDVVGFPYFQLVVIAPDRIHLPCEFMFFDKDRRQEVVEQVVNSPSADSVNLRGWPLIELEWDEVLGYRVSLERCKTKAMKYVAAAELLYELTYFDAFSASQKHEALAEFEDNLENCEGQVDQDEDDEDFCRKDLGVNSLDSCFEFNDKFACSLASGVVALLDDKFLQLDLARELIQYETN